MVGVLWSVFGAMAAFGSAAVFCLAGTMVLARVRGLPSKPRGTLDAVGSGSAL